jgi:hypothetical protein
MAANTTPRFTLLGDVSSDGVTTSSAAMAPTFTTAAADYDGTTATHNKTVFTAGSEGSRIVGLRFKAKGSNVVTVARIFINNGSTPGTAANNSFFGEISLPATTASATASTPEIDYYFPAGHIDLPPGFKIIVGLGTTVAAGWVCTPIQGGKF